VEKKKSARKSQAGTSLPAALTGGVTGGEGAGAKGGAGTAVTPAMQGPVKMQKDGCHVCGRTVYMMEKQEMDKKIFHKACMRCKECNKMIKPGNCASLDGSL